MSANCNSYTSFLKTPAEIAACAQKSFETVMTSPSSATVADWIVILGLTFTGVILCGILFAVTNR
jgi:hypothetical protein